MLHTYEQHSKKKLVAIILSLVVIAGFVVFADHVKAKTAAAAGTLAQSSSSAPSSTPSMSASTDSTTATNTSSPAASSTSSYKDGTYSASSSYYVPHGNESIQVSLTLKDGVITSSSIRNSEGDPESAQYQQDFASSYKSYVVGKKISGLQLGILAGASDTTQGFDNALSQIASEAQA